MPVDPTSIPTVRLPRVFIPRGKLAIAFVAAAAVPILWRELTKRGRKVNESDAPKPEERVEEPAKAAADTRGAAPKAAPRRTQKRAAAPKSKMSSKTAKTGKRAGGNPISSSSPAGQEEVQQQAAAEMQGAAAPPKRTRPKRATATKKLPPIQPKNPKKPKS